MNVEAIHALADLEEIRARSFNAVVSAQQDIATIMTALARPEPKVAVCLERLEQLQDDLNRIRAYLESKK